MTSIHTGPRWDTARRKTLARDGHRCTACERGKAEGVGLHVDHITRVADGGDPYDLTNLQTLCVDCHRRKTGRELAGDNRARARRGPRGVVKDAEGRVSDGASLTPAPIPSFSGGPPPSALDGSEEPGSARYFSDQHPSAVGTRGPEWEAWVLATFGERARPWQASVASRLLAVDADGLWCWGAGFVVSVPRQHGKSWLLRMLLAWWASQGLLCLATMNRLRTSGEVLRPLGVWVKANGGRWRQSLDQPSVDWPTGEGRVVFQAATDALAVGWSPQVGAVDEAWDVPEDPVQHGLIPAMASQDNPLLLLTSTVGVATSTLMGTFRDLAMAGEAGVGLAEWSAPPGADWLDEQVWRDASPSWSAQRLRFLRKQARVMTESRFRAEFLNQSVTALDSWITPSRWAACARTGPMPEGLRPTVAALEVALDGSMIYAVLAGRDSDGLVHLDVARHPHFRAADHWLSQVRPSVVLAPPQFRDRVSRIDRHVGASEVAAAMPQFESVVNDGRLRHPGDDRLSEQMLLAQRYVNKADRQTLISADGSSLAAVRAMLWAVDEVGVERAGRPMMRVAR